MPNWIKKCIGCLLLLVFCYVLLSVIKTYGLFEDDLNKEVQNTAASFVLVINNSYINKDNSTFTINDVVTNNSNVATNKLAPGTSGYYDIVLDPKNIKVAVRYDITYDLSANTNSKITMTSIMNNNTNTSLVRTGEFTYSGVISLTDALSDTSTVVRTTLTWANDETNNETDSTMKESISLNIPVSITLTQYLGEELEVYVGE